MILLTDSISQSSNFCWIVLDETTYYISAFAVDSNGTIIDVQGMSIKTDFAFHGYQRVEYIQSDGNCRISTGYICNSNMKIILDFDLMGYHNPDVIFGTTNTQWTWTSPLAFNDNTTNTGINYPFNIGAGGQDHPYVSFQTVNGRSNLTFTLSSIILNGTTQTKSLTTLSQELSLFYGNGKGGRGKIYSCKLYTGNTLIKDFYPVYRKSDNVIGLLDTVNKQFYTNSGSGSFTKGPNV